MAQRFGAPLALRASRRPSMKHRLSNRLSPAAKKAALTAPPGEPVHVLLQVAAGTDPEALRRGLEALGAKVSSWMEETHLLAAAVPASRLEEAADLPGITYVEAGAAYRR